MNDKALRWVVELGLFPLLALAFFRWGAALDWQFDRLDGLRIFPLLGLIAFTTMWWHFLVGFVRQLRPDFQKFETLHRLSGYWVFVAIILHPLLVWWWGVGEGKSGLSEPIKAYTGGGRYQYAQLGLYALIVFLLFDLARWLRERPWIKRHWRLIDAADDAAFLVIWYHSFNLGQHIDEGWFRLLWLFYGLSGLGFILFKRLRPAASHAPATPPRP